MYEQNSNFLWDILALFAFQKDSNSIRQIMNAIKETLEDVLKPKSSLLSKCIGVAIATVTYFIAGMLMLPVPCCEKNANARRQGVAVLNSLVLSGAYLYSWREGNPHKAEALENSPTYEIPLMLTAGYYILDSFSFKSFIDILHHIISLCAILGLLMEGRAANIGVTFAFLVEMANLVYNVRKIAIQFQSPCVILLNILYPTVFIFVRFVALLHLSYNIVNNKDLPEIPQTLASILFMMSFFYCFRMFQHVFGTSPDEISYTRRSRSRTPRVSRTSKKRRCSRTSKCGLVRDLYSLFQ